MTRRLDHCHPTPPGFTLLELVVVIGIIALLASLSFTVIGNMLASAKEAATETTIVKISGLLNGQIAGFERQYDPRDPDFKTLAGRFRSGFYALTADTQTSEVFAKKAAYLRAYPQNVYEAAGFDRKPLTDDDIPLYTNWLTSNTTSKADSSELLYLAMTQGKVRGVTPVDSSAFNSSELGDTDKDGFTELVDAWGEPLRFYRWPTRLINPFGFIANVLAGPVNSTSTSIDLLDASDFAPVPTPFRIVVGRETMEVSNVSGMTLTVTRGAQSTDAQSHSAGSLVKLAPLTEVASMLLGFINSATLAHDADDPRGVTSQLNSAGSFANISDLTGTPFSSTTAAGDFELIFHTLDSYHVPLIVSAGPDGELGLVEPGPTGATGTTTEPANFWLPGSATTGNAWRWGALAQPDTKDGTDFAILTNPGGSTLADNITNHTAGVN